MIEEFDKYPIFYAYQKHVTPGCVLVSYRRKNLLSKLIWFFSGKPNLITGKASHVALFLSKSTIIEADSRGVKTRSLKSYDPKKYEITILRPKFDFDEHQLMLEAQFALQRGYKYSYIQLFALLLRSLFKLKRVGDWARKAVMCSELICGLFRSVRVKIFPYFDSCADVIPAQYLATQNWFETAAYVRDGSTTFTNP